MCEASTKINDRHLDFQIEQFLSSGQTEYITDSITYKKGTVILEESQQLKFAYKLALSGIKVTIEESQEVIQNLKNIYGELFTYVERK
jgi:hypothetical protein